MTTCRLFVQFPMKVVFIMTVLSKEDRQRKIARASEILNSARAAGRDMTAEESRQTETLLAEVELSDAMSKRSDGGVETRGLGSGQAVRGKEIQGSPVEEIRGGQGFTEYVRRAAENGVSTQANPGATPRRMEWRDREYLNEYAGALLGFNRKSTVATRAALGEDTTSGSGAAQAIAPQAWTAQVIEYLLPNSVSAQLGVSFFNQPTELYNLPVATGIPLPTWIAENGAVSLDGNSQFSKLQMNAQGGFKSEVAYSVELAQDAYISGGLSDYLSAQIAREMSLVLDTALLTGISGNSAGNPGIINESGFNTRHATGDAGGGAGFTPADTIELSKINTLVRGTFAPNEGFLSNHKVEPLFSTVKGSSGYPAYFPRSADVAGIPWVSSPNSTIMPATETDPTTATSVALTGGTFSSLYAGPWSFVKVGVHLDATIIPLRERLVDNGQVGLFYYQRFSVRTANPQCFFRTIGMAA